MHPKTHHETITIQDPPRPEKARFYSAAFSSAQVGPEQACLCNVLFKTLRAVRRARSFISSIQVFMMLEPLSLLWRYFWDHFSNLGITVGVL